MDAPFTFITDVGNGIFSAGQIDFVQWPSTTITKKTGKAKAGELRGAGAVLHWMVIP